MKLAFEVASPLDKYHMDSQLHKQVSLIEDRPRGLKSASGGKHGSRLNMVIFKSGGL